MLPSSSHLIDNVRTILDRQTDRQTDKQGQMLSSFASKNSNQIYFETLFTQFKDKSLITVWYSRLKQLWLKDFIFIDGSMNAPEKRSWCDQKGWQILSGGRIIMHKLLANHVFWWRIGITLRGHFPRMFVHQVLEENWAKIKWPPNFISLPRLGHGLDFTIISEHYYTVGSNGQHSD